MKLMCSNCQDINKLNSDQIQFVEKMKTEGSTFIMLPCNSCGTSFPYNPQKEFNNQEEENSLEPIWRSPVSGSHGYVVKVDEGNQSFYGCGETGRVWHTLAELSNSIEQIIERYPHRRNFYVNVDNCWMPNENEPENADELIEEEDFE